MSILSAPALALTLSLAASAGAQAQIPAAENALKAGDVVSFDLTVLPARFEGEAKATCVGTRIAATGPIEARCERAVRFEVDPAGARMTFVFRGSPKAGGKESRIDLPLLRERKPVTFVAPSDGTLEPPSPITLKAETVEQAARSAAAPQCRECRGEGFRLESVKVTREPLPPGGALPFRIGIARTVPASEPPR